MVGFLAQFCMHFLWQAGSSFNAETIDSVPDRSAYSQGIRIFHKMCTKVLNGLTLSIVFNNKYAFDK